MTFLLLLILITTPVSVVGVVGRVASTSSTHNGPIEVEGSARRGVGRRGLDDKVRLRPDAPHSLHTPVRVAVEVTITMTSNKTTTMLAMTTTTALRSPAEARCVELSR